MVTTAFASGTPAAAAKTAAPPRLCPIRIAGARYILRMWFAAAIRSATLEENVVLANSPSLAPSPVKSKRSTATPQAVSPSAMRFAARMSLPQVKQCANSAYAEGSPAGRSSSAARRSPRALGKVKRSVGMRVSPLSSQDFFAVVSAQAGTQYSQKARLSTPAQITNGGVYLGPRLRGDDAAGVPN